MYTALYKLMYYVITTPFLTTYVNLLKQKQPNKMTKSNGVLLTVYITNTNMHVYWLQVYVTVGSTLIPHNCNTTVSLRTWTRSQVYIVALRNLLSQSRAVYVYSHMQIVCVLSCRVVITLWMYISYAGMRILRKGVYLTGTCYIIYLPHRVLYTW